MKRKSLILILVNIFLVACTQEEAEEKETVSPTMPIEGAAPSTTADILIVTATPPPTLAEREREQAELRKGEVKMYNLENVGVEGSLQKGVMALLEAVKNQDNEEKLKLH